MCSVGGPPGPGLRSTALTLSIKLSTVCATDMNDTSNRAAAGELCYYFSQPSDLKFSPGGL